MSVKIIDDDGGEIGCIEKKYLVPLGLKHEIVRVILYTEKNHSILLQQRSFRDASCPGQWDTSASGHVDAHEPAAEAAIRELQEESGVSAELSSLSFIDSFDTSEKLDDGWLKRRNTVFYIKGDWSLEGLKFNKDEVERLEWVGIESALSGKLELTPGAKTAIELFGNWIKNWPGVRP